MKKEEPFNPYRRNVRREEPKPEGISMEEVEAGNFADYCRKAPAVVVLAAVNVLFFLYAELTGGSMDIGHMAEIGACVPSFVVLDGEYWRLLTAAFLHFGIQHIANNMLILLVMGGHLERALGHIRFVIFYLLSAVIANGISCFRSFAAAERVVSAGASGAVFAVTGGLLFAAVRNRGRFEDLSIKQLVIMAALSLFLGFRDTGVNNTAHVSGLIAGLLLAMLFYRPGRRRQEGAGLEKADRQEL